VSALSGVPHRFGVLRKFIFFALEPAPGTCTSLMLVGRCEFGLGATPNSISGRRLSGRWHCGWFTICRVFTARKWMPEAGLRNRKTEQGFSPNACLGGVSLLLLLEIIQDRYPVLGGSLRLHLSLRRPHLCIEDIDKMVSLAIDRASGPDHGLGAECGAARKRAVA
jgi:hypothetical protein